MSVIEQPPMNPVFISEWEDEDGEHGIVSITQGRQGVAVDIIHLPKFIRALQELVEEEA